MVNEKVMESYISEIEFLPVRPHKGHIGFISFVYNDSFKLNNIAVYTRLSGDGSQYRLVYPFDACKRSMFFPINKEVSILVEKEVSCYIENVLRK